MRSSRDYRNRVIAGCVALVAGWAILLVTVIRVVDTVARERPVDASAWVVIVVLVVAVAASALYVLSSNRSRVRAVEAETLAAVDDLIAKLNPPTP